MDTIVRILSVSYSWEKSSGSGEGVANFRNQAQACTKLVHVISRLISLIDRLLLGYNQLVLATKSWVLGFLSK